MILGIILLSAGPIGLIWLMISEHIEYRKYDNERRKRNPHINYDELDRQRYFKMD